jgi:hypothetical protein
VGAAIRVLVSSHIWVASFLGTGILPMVSPT